MRTSMRCATFVLGFALAVEILTSCADTSVSSSAPNGPTQLATAVQTVETAILPGQRDELAPIESADGLLSVSQVIQRLQADGSLVPYAASLATTSTIQLGSYSNSGLTARTGRPTKDIPAYIFGNLHGKCTPSGSYGRPSAPQDCIATLVVDATDGSLLMSNESW